MNRGECEVKPERKVRTQIACIAWTRRRAKTWLLTLTNNFARCPAVRYAETCSGGHGTLHEWEGNSTLKRLQSDRPQSRADCEYLFSRPGHRTPPATGPRHSPRCDECHTPSIVLWIARTPEKRYPQSKRENGLQRTRGAKCGSRLLGAAWSLNARSHGGL